MRFRSAPRGGLVPLTLVGVGPEQWEGWGVFRGPPSPAPHPTPGSEQRAGSACGAASPGAGGKLRHRSRAPALRHGQGRAGGNPRNPPCPQHPPHPCSCSLKDWEQRRCPKPAHLGCVLSSMPTPRLRGTVTATKGWGQAVPHSPALPGVSAAPSARWCRRRRGRRAAPSPSFAPRGFLQLSHPLFAAPNASPPSRRSPHPVHRCSSPAPPSFPRADPLHRHHPTVLSCPSALLSLPRHRTPQPHHLHP